MINYLRGEVRIFGNELSLICNGVGYHIHANQSLISKISSLAEVELFIHTHVREDQLELFGFESIQEKQVFQLLISVGGVGPKTAIAMFNHGAEPIVEAIKQADIAFFSSVPRVGKKLAQKIIIELKNKVGGLKDIDLSPASQEEQEVFEALLALGFENNKISSVLQSMDKTDKKVEDLVREAINLIANN